MYALKLFLRLDRALRQATAEQAECMKDLMKLVKYKDTLSLPISSNEKNQVGQQISKYIDTIIISLNCFSGGNSGGSS